MALFGVAKPRVRAPAFGPHFLFMCPQGGRRDSLSMLVPTNPLEGPMGAAGPSPALKVVRMPGVNQQKGDL